MRTEVRDSSSLHLRPSILHPHSSFFPPPSDDSVAFASTTPPSPPRPSRGGESGSCKNQQDLREASSFSGRLASCEFQLVRVLTESS